MKHDRPRLSPMDFSTLGNLLRNSPNLHTTNYGIISYSLPQSVYFLWTENPSWKPLHREVYDAVKIINYHIKIMKIINFCWFQVLYVFEFNKIGHHNVVTIPISVLFRELPLRLSLCSSQLLLVTRGCSINSVALQLSFAECLLSKNRCYRSI